MSCRSCEQADKEERRTKLLNDARDWAKKEGHAKAVILEAPNGFRFYCAAGDPRAARLTVIEFVSVLP